MGEVRTFEASLADFAGVEAGALIPDGVRQVNPGSMSVPERQSLVKQIQDGEVFALRFRMRAFGSGPNLNNARLTPAQIDELATTATNADLMADHSWSVMATIGETVGGEARDMDGERVLVLEHDMTDPDAMVRFVRRQLRRSSVSIEAADWQMSPSGTEILAVSPVRLVHNAFVSDPAYRAASVLDNQTHKRQPMPEENKTGAPDQSARIAELEAQNAALSLAVDDLKSRLEARESEAFAAELDRAQEQGKVLPAARAQFDAVRKAMGFDAARALLAGLSVGHAVPVQQVGESPKSAPAAVTLSSQGISTPEQIAKRVQEITGKPYDPAKIGRI